MRAKLLIYRVGKMLGLFALARRLTASRIRILCYHGAAFGDEGRYNPLLFISRNTFERRMNWLQNAGFNVIPLDAAIDAMDSRTVAGRLPVVVTFDDGWHSTAAQLIPIMAQHGLPSTLYLCTSHFEEGWPVLMVTVNYMLWKSGRKRVDLQGFGELIDGTYSLDQAADRDLLVGRSCQWLGQAPATRSEIVERVHAIAKSLGLGPDDVDLASHRFDYMSREELLCLPNLQCDVELHGHRHLYPAGNPTAFAADIAACRAVIVGLGLPEPCHYCYPSGSFDKEAEAVLKGSGVRSATTCTPGLIASTSRCSQPYYLPRFLDGDSISMLVFEAEMSGFADVLRRLLRR